MLYKSNVLFSLQERVWMPCCTATSSTTTIGPIPSSLGCFFYFMTVMFDDSNKKKWWSKEMLLFDWCRKNTFKKRYSLISCIVVVLLWYTQSWSGLGLDTLLSWSAVVGAALATSPPPPARLSGFQPFVRQSVQTMRPVVVFFVKTVWFVFVCRSASWCWRWLSEVQPISACVNMAWQRRRENSRWCSWWIWMITFRFQLPKLFSRTS